MNCPLNLSCQQWRNCFTSIAPFKNEHVKFGFGIISELNLYVSGDFIREIYPKEVWFLFIRYENMYQSVIPIHIQSFLYSNDLYAGVFANYSVTFRSSRKHGKDLRRYVAPKCRWNTTEQVIFVWNAKSSWKTETATRFTCVNLPLNRIMIFDENGWRIREWKMWLNATVEF